MENRGYSHPELLTSPEELSKVLDRPGLCLIDTRPAEEFAQGHIPGAAHFDLFGLSCVDTSPAPLKAFLAMIHHVMELRGAGDEKEIVFYEELSGMRAARGLWFLELFGHPNVHILDGGIRAWKEAGYATTTEAKSPQPGQLWFREHR